MSLKITPEELNIMIANSIREKGLNNAFDSKAIDKIKNKIINTLGQKDDKPKEEILENNVDMDNNNEQIITNSDNGAVQHQVELPEFLNKIEPAKVIVFDENELSHGGENLSRVEYRTMENPDQKCTMRDFWLKEGKRKAEVYVARFEKIGEIEYNHMDGTSRFLNLSKIEDFQPSNYENPYSNESTPQEAREREVEALIKNSVDLESIISKKIDDVLAKHFSSRVDVAPAVSPTTYNLEYNDLNMNQIASGDNFVKVDTPTPIAETFNGNKNYAVTLMIEGSDFNVFEFEGREFILPKNPISTRKCYTKKY